MTRTTVRSEDITAGQVKSADLASDAVPEFDDSTLQDNIALLGFKMAVNDSLTQYGMVDGIVDEFHDESGVDTSGSTNLTYDATSDYYTGYTSGTTEHSWSYTGSDQAWTTPANTVSGVVKAYGGNGTNGGHSGYGGEGGFVHATIPLSSSTAYVIVVGEQGDYWSQPSGEYGGGGGASWQASGSGGGLTGIFTGSAAIDFDNSSSNGAASQARALIIAGGGGGFGHYHYGCHGSDQWAGGDVTSSGGSGTGTNNSAGTQTYMAGGDSSAGGGGGYNGGNGSGSSAGGNSGTNFVHSSATSTTTNSGLAHVSDADELGQGNHGQMKITTTQQAALDITMLSNGFTAQSAPSTVRAVVFEEDVDAVTINTDLKIYASRDGGSNWSQITLADEGDYDTGKQIWSGEVDVSGQPSGTSVKYKITTHNTKQLRLHGVSLSWS